MSHASTHADQDSAPPWRLKSIDPIIGILAAIAAGERLAVVTATSAGSRNRFLDQLIPALQLSNCRVLRATSMTARPFDLRCLMDQLVGPGPEDVTEKAARFCRGLTKAEPPLTLIVEDAHLVTDQTLHYLALITSFASDHAVALQLLLVGAPRLWRLLPASGSLTEATITTRISLSDEYFTDDAPAAHAAANPDSAAPVRVAAEGPAQPPPADEAFRTAAAAQKFAMQSLTVQSPLVVAQQEPLALSQRRAANARRLSWTALAVGVVVAGGVSAIGLRDFPLGRSILPDLDVTRHLALWLGNSDPVAAPQASWSTATPAVAEPKPIRLASTEVTEAVERHDLTAPAPVIRLVQPIVEPRSDRPVQDMITTAAQPSAPAGGSDDPQPPDAASSADVATKQQSQTPAPAVLASSKPVKVAASAPIAVPAPAPVAVPVHAPATVPTSAPVVIAPAAATTSPQAPPRRLVQPMSPDVMAVLLARGDALLAAGDVVAARLMFERAAGSESGTAATAMGMTYDPRFLTQIGAQGVAPEPQRAMDWYRRASDLGSPVAMRLLTQLQAVGE